MAMTTHTAHIVAVQSAARTRTWASDLRLGGGLLFVAGATILMGIIKSPQFQMRTKVAESAKN